MKKDANIPEDDWKKTWNSGTYDYLAPGYVPGTHEIERGEVTWHQLRPMPDAKDAPKDNVRQDHAREEGDEE
jgi:hypothetical protein